MSKVKWSFSLILAALLVGILSTAAFARDLYTLKIVQNGSDLEVSFTGNSNDATDIEGRQFDLVLKDGSQIIKTYGPVALNSSNQGTFNIPSGDIQVGKVYSVELYHTDDTNHTSMLSVSSGLVIDNSYNTSMYHIPDTHVDVNGTGLVNANQTGVNNLSKQRSGQKVHGLYQNNTNSCASCHQTHTAKDNNLLFKDGIYSTCSACHDGTTGAYNSFTPTNNNTSNSIAGTFDVINDAHGSLHQADGSLKINAAPGGNSDSKSKIWNQDFDCASCHAPHGSGSADENNLNIDPLGWGGVQYYPVGATKADGTIATIDDANGKLFKDIPIYNITDIPTTMDKPYILVKDHLADQSAVDNNFFYKRAKVPAGADVIQTYRWENNKYVPDYSLWLRDIGYKKAPFQNANTVLYDSNSTDITTKDITVIWRDGFAFGTGINNVKKANVSLGIDVETTGNIRSLYDPTFKVLDSEGNEDPTKSYIPDSGVEMTKYCSSCHTDFMSNQGTNETGILTAYHRHQGLTDQFTCVRCHFAHGTKSTIMKDSTENLAAAVDSLSSETHSSALRRYIDLESCYSSGCHSKDSSSPDYLTSNTNTLSTTSVTSTSSATNTSNTPSSSSSSTDSTSSATNTSTEPVTPTTDSTAPAADPTSASTP